MTGCMISGWGNAARTGYGSKFEKLLMKGVVGYVDKATCNQKHGEGLSILFLWLHTFRRANFIAWDRCYLKNT